MKYRRTVGGLAALATMAGGGALAFASPSYAGSVTVSFPAKSAGDSSVNVLRNSLGQVSGIVAKGKAIAKPSSSGSSPEAAAEAHIKRFAPALGVDASDLTATSVSKVPGGSTVKFQQREGGLPVVAGQFVASLDKSGNLQALLGEGTKGQVASVKSPLAHYRGASIAKQYIAKKLKVPAVLLQSVFKDREVLDPTLIGSPGALPIPRKVQVYKVTDRSGALSYNVYVDEGLKGVSLAISNNSNALNRKICDAKNSDVGDLAGGKCDNSAQKYVRTEGGAPTGQHDADEVYANLGTVAKWYAAYDNIDVTKLITDPKEQGGNALRATVRVCGSQIQQGCPMQNAFWSGDTKQMYYGEGFTMLDVTGHELTHGVTGATAGLMEIYQSGALNESLSDIAGEIIDQATNPSKRTGTNAWILGDEFADARLKRNMADPTKSGMPQPDKMTSNLWDQGTGTPDGDQGGVHANDGVGNKTAYLIAHGDTFNGYTIRGLGLAKTMHIYWTVQNLLTSGADYKDLFNVLPLACQKNIGRAGSFLTKDDCAQVDKAVRATELYKPAAGDGGPVRVDYCPTGKQVKRSYFQGFDSAAAAKDWKPVGDTAGLASYSFGWPYAQTGADAAMLFTQDGQGTSASLEQSTGTKIPAGSFLRIDYATQFGAQQVDNTTTASLQYNDGSGWKNASSLAGSDNGGPWKGHSKGYAGAKWNLSSLAGKTVKFRVSVSGLPSDGTYSLFFVDNVKVYTCA